MAPKKQKTIEQTLGRPKTKPMAKTSKRVTRSSGPTKQSKLGSGSTSSPSFIGSSQVVVGHGSAKKKPIPTKRVAFFEDSDTDGNEDKGQDEDDENLVELAVRGGKKAAAAAAAAVAATQKPLPAHQEEEEEDADVVELPARWKKGATTQGRKWVSLPQEDDDGVDRLPVRGGSDGDDDDLKVVGVRQRGTKRKVVSSSSASEEDSDDTPLVTPVSTRKRQRLVLASDSSSDGDDEPIISSPARRRRLVRGSSPVKPAVHDDNDDEGPIRRPSSVRRSAKKPLTAKEKARELLRRKRAGEVVEEDEDEEEEEEEVVKKGLYDTDSDNVALSEFEDDEEDEGSPKAQEPVKVAKKKSKEKEKKKEWQKRHDDDDSDNAITDSEDSIDDFVVDDPDGLLGVPDELLDIPLEFTRHSHKKLKDHFRDVIEWLVQFKINPGSADKTNELYRIGWQKLDDEVRGLAQSKFASSAWQMDFHKALRARPERHNTELPKGDFADLRSCGACGRSGHPATWVVQFTGPAYVKKFGPNFFDPIEPDSDSDEDDPDADDVDEDGNSIPKETKQWFVGSVCNMNAETAHDLIHWKHSLLDWVDTRLMEDGYMLAPRLAERLKWKPKKLYKLVDEIVQKWEDDGVIKALFKGFEANLDKARSQTTSGRWNRR